MLASFLVEDAVRREDGNSTPLELGEDRGSTLMLTLGITRIVEQQSLDITVQGSADGQTFDPKPLAIFPQKFYCGTYSILVDLSATPDTRFLRISWKMNRWGRGEPHPLFGFYVFAETANAAVAAAY